MFVVATKVANKFDGGVRHTHMIIFRRHIFIELGRRGYILLRRSTQQTPRALRIHSAESVP
jgi:hypothetical protein